MFMGIAGAFVCLIVPHASAVIGDIYVDAANVTPPFEGTPANPYTTIHQAIISPAVSGDVIHVASGNYNADLGEVFPIEVPGGVTIEGPASGPLPQIGGDLIDESVASDALVLIDATGSDVNDVTIRRLKFLGENEVDLDSPVALRVLAEGHTVDGLVFEYNTCTRPYQNDLGQDGDSTVVVSGENAEVGGWIRHNIVEASHRGGIEVVALVNEEYGSAGFAGLVLEDNHVSNPSGTTATFGITFQGLDGGASSFAMSGPGAIDRNTVLSRGDGISYGIALVCEEHSDYNHVNSMEGNQINGCGLDGLLISTDGWNSSTNPEIAITHFRNNTIRDNTGAGIHLQWDRTGSDGGKGYIHFIAAEGNLIAENGVGFDVEGIGVDSSYGIQFINTTIADNGKGIDFTATQFDVDPAAEFTEGGWSFRNCIMRNDGDELDGLDGDLEDIVDELLAQVFYSNWEGIASSQGNIDANPVFITVPRPTYHLDDGSPCIDAGNNSYVQESTLLDIDGEPRIQDGDFNCEGSPVEVVDMGCDEVPEPDCP